MLSIKPLPTFPHLSCAKVPPPMWRVSAWPGPGDEAGEVEAAVARRLNIRIAEFIGGRAHYATEERCARVCGGMAAEMPGFEFWPERLR